MQITRLRTYNKRKAIIIPENAKDKFNQGDRFTAYIDDEQNIIIEKTNQGNLKLRIIQKYYNKEYLGIILPTEITNHFKDRLFQVIINEDTINLVSFKRFGE